MNKYTEKAQDYFERHPSSNECHITSDGRVFHTKGSALGFAGTLDSQDIESYTRKGLEKETTEVTAKEVLEGNRPEKIKELEALELVTANYNEMKALAKYFEVKTDNQKAETFIAALTEFKKTLNQD
ncbi:hypothetical protein ASG31_08405 [Chryseobacterium sp. Leaf404]|uniref:hypothetical protein n=1 Tax=unclassified Chryseobacterium TaxID=2593645 RepID=UPI0006FEB5B4|nr:MULTISPECIES: hypothetical protein [unclassified Chryseobacterium]KQT17422.1 hypothetical protein ASG31_08405 [Chryseobacterium sp. Leaf404]